MLCAFLDLGDSILSAQIFVYALKNAHFHGLSFTYLIISISIYDLHGIQRRKETELQQILHVNGGTP